MKWLFKIVPYRYAQFTLFKGWLLKYPAHIPEAPLNFESLLMFEILRQSQAANLMYLAVMALSVGLIIAGTTFWLCGMQTQGQASMAGVLALGSVCKLLSADNNSRLKMLVEQHQAIRADNQKN
jgi:cyanate permease